MMIFQMYAADSAKHIKAPVIKDGAMVGIINVSNITKYVLKDLTENIA